MTFCRWQTFQISYRAHSYGVVSRSMFVLDFKIFAQVVCSGNLQNLRDKDGLLDEFFTSIIETTSSRFSLGEEDCYGCHFFCVFGLFTNSFKHSFFIRNSILPFNSLQYQDLSQLGFSICWDMVRYAGTQFALAQPFLLH